MLKNNSINLFSGKTFCLSAPQHHEYDIYDIAHSLAAQCAFLGHTKHFYSFAQRALNIVNILPDELKLAGLLNDAHKSYIGDIPQSIAGIMPEYQHVKSLCQCAIWQHFNIEVDTLDMELIKKAESVILRLEFKEFSKIKEEELDLEKLTYNDLNKLKKTRPNLRYRAISEIEIRYIREFNKLNK